MHIPSLRVSNEMRSEEASLWIVPANGGETISVLIKAPSSSIKALISGCRLSIPLGAYGAYLCVGAQIFDMPDAPVLISGAVCENEEQEALERLLHERRAPIFLFNEMNICLAWSNLDVSQETAEAAQLFIERTKPLYTGQFTQDCLHALDCFCLSVDSTIYSSNATKIPLIELLIQIEPWRCNKITFISMRGYHDLAIDNINEGEMFERAIWASLESVFPLTLHKSPQVHIGNKLREFTDVLSYHLFGTFLIEAKDLSILTAGFERDQERRTKSVQKQTMKAIGQLVGACKAMNRGEKIVTADGNEEIPLVRDKPPHCIVLITELMNYGDWSMVEGKLVEAMKQDWSFFSFV